MLDLETVWTQRWKGLIIFSKRYVWIFEKIPFCGVMAVQSLFVVCHLEISSLLLMTAKNIDMLTFVSLKLCFLGFVHHHNELFFSYLWSFIRKFISSEEIWNRADGKRTPTHFLIIIDLRLGLFSYAEVYASKVTFL